jgi:hypothetical protein
MTTFTVESFQGKITSSPVPVKFLHIVLWCKYEFSSPCGRSFTYLHGRISIPASKLVEEDFPLGFEFRHA